jgi:hypothetical protein
MQPVVIFDLLLLTPCSRLSYSIYCYSHHAAICYIQSAATHTMQPERIRSSASHIMQPVDIFDLLLLTSCSRLSYSIYCYSCYADIKIFDLLIFRRQSCRTLDLAVIILSTSRYHFTLPDHPSFLFKYCNSFSFFSKKHIFGYKTNSGTGISKTFVGKLIGNKPHTRYKKSV